MKLKDLVGKMAIRTQKARGFAPWETDRAIRLDFMVPVPIFDDRERYMDEPVKIVAVEESQVVIERDGKRELLERKYVDEHWTDYDKFLHPEKEEQKKLEDMVKEIKAAAEPLRRFLEKYYDPMVKVTVETDRVVVERGELQTLFQEGELDEAEDTE